MLNSRTKNYVHALLWITFVIGSLTFIYAFPPQVAFYPIPNNSDEVMLELVKIGMENRIIADKDGKIIYASPSAAKITEYSQAELKDSKIGILIPERYMPRHSDKMSKALKRHDGKIASTKCYLKTKSDREIPVEIRARVKVSDPLGGEIMLVTLTELQNLVE